MTSRPRTRAEGAEVDGGAIGPLTVPLTMLVPESNWEPVVIYDSQAALRMAVVERDGVGGLGEEWDVPGTYLLLDPVAEDGSYGAYAGKAPSGLRSRLTNHARNREHWRRALLIAKDTTYGFHSAHVGWLEGRLYDLLDSAEFANLSNGNRPRDETLPAYERATLEASLVPVQRVLRVLGYNPETLPRQLSQHQELGKGPVASTGSR